MRWVLGHLRAVAEVVTGRNGDEAKCATHDDGDVDEPQLLAAGVIHRLEDIWHRREEAEQCRELAGDVKVDEGHNGLGEEHGYRAKKGEGHEHSHLGPERRRRRQR